MIKGRLIKLLSGARKFVFRQVLALWISLLCQITVVFCITDIVQKLFTGEALASLFPRYGAAVLLCFVFRFAADRFYVLASHKAGADVKVTLRSRIYKKLLSLGASYRDAVPTSEAVQLALDGVEQLEIYFGKYLAQFIYSLLAPLTLFTVLAFVSIKASAVLLLFVPLIPLSIAAIMKVAKYLLRKYWGMYAELGDSFLENLQGLTTLKIYRADGQKTVEMDAEAEKFRRITMKVLSMQLNSTSIMDIMAYGGAAAGMIIALAQFAGSAVGLGGCLMIVLLSAEFFIPVRLLGSFFHVAMNGMAASDKIFALLDMPEEGKPCSAFSAQKVSLDFSKVSFSYSADRGILKDVSIRCKPESFTAIAGKSGCGKSTIAGLIMTRNKNYEGSIRFNDTELSSIAEDSLMKTATLVTHESYIFKGTVVYNLRMGNPDASEQDMKRALKKVNLSDYFDSQQGLETMLAEKGSDLSGGQCQRLALARALLHDSPVYIFDEATSNIDAESEEMIMSVIKTLAKKKTVIFISHKLSNVIDAACIYMMEDGRVIEEGTHAQLLKRKGKYALMYNEQHKLESYARGEE
ncbi:ABC transporter ATP-binding protein/permease [Treponema sp. HNW]|uniref:ABC transporter ATP-binding protein/permease n=1 Tax=Treponema sp. HNW TaxID=3116654 RepID=UPI003D1366D9